MDNLNGSFGSNIHRLRDINNQDNTDNLKYVNLMLLVIQAFISIFLSPDHDEELYIYNQIIGICTLILTIILIAIYIYQRMQANKPILQIGNFKECLNLTFLFTSICQSFESILRSNNKFMKLLATVVVGCAFIARTESKTLPNDTESILYAFGIVLHFLNFSITNNFCIAILFYFAWKQIDEFFNKNPGVNNVIVTSFNVANTFLLSILTQIANYIEQSSVDIKNTSTAS
ncbi:hypothetical protein NUSPORA_00608 [Nucleospora cyclopteri]